MKKNKRFIARLACAVFVIIMLFSALFVVHAAGHDCIGAGCAVCAQIASCEQLMKPLAITVFAAATVIMLTFLVNVYFRYSAAAVRQNSPVALKTKLSN